MNELPFISTSPNFLKLLKKLRSKREKVKTFKGQRKRLTNNERSHILQKTDSQCHVCGRQLTIDDFEADHVKSYASGGGSHVDNFLPACRTCNNYRWNYLSEEFQWILKLGVWLRTEMEKETGLGKNASEAFIKYEVGREKRRRKPRIKNS